MFAELALLELETPFEGDTSRLVQTLPPADTAIEVLGYGRSDISSKRPCGIKRVPIEEVTENCQYFIDQSGSTANFGTLTCVKTAKLHDAGTCVGDSGAGTYFRSGENTYIHSLVLGGFGCDKSDINIHASNSLIYDFIVGLD